jgi:hypothetical protein
VSPPPDSPTPFIRFAHRSSDAAFVHRVWTAESYQGGDFTSVAYPQSEIVVTHLEGTVTVSLRGPETHATRASCPPSGSWVGIRLRGGVRMTALDLATSVDGGVTLPTTGKRFAMAGDIWEVPTADDAEVFVAKLVRAGLLVRDPLVHAVLSGATPRDDVRTVQRRFVRSTGLSRQAIAGIERAHAATFMLRRGATILDTVAALGFADQPHLTRVLKRLVGLTPAQLAAVDTSQLSFMPPLESR